MYKITTTGGILRIADGACVPNDPRNTDYADYLKWLAAGNAVAENTLVEVRAHKVASLASACNAALALLPPVAVAGNQFPATPEYRAMVANLARRSNAGRVIPTSIRDINGVPVTLTPTLLNLIDDVLEAQAHSQWVSYWAKCDAVKAASTVAAVRAIAE